MIIPEGGGQEEPAGDPYELMGTEYPEPDSVDFADLASIYDEEELGSIFKKIGKAVKKATKTVGTVAKKTVKKVANNRGQAGATAFECRTGWYRWVANLDSY